MAAMSDERGDAALAAALAAGEEAAAREVTGWVRRAASPFRFRLGDDWDDAVQACLVEVLSSLAEARYSATGALRGYVWRLTVRTCIDRLRARTRWRWVELDSERDRVAASALADVLESERRARLARVMTQISEPCRNLWQLVLAGRSYREMSVLLGVGEGALRVRVLRCRRRAQELLERPTASNLGAPGALMTTEGQDLES